VILATNESWELEVLKTFFESTEKALIDEREALKIIKSSRALLLQSHYIEKGIVPA
jgi:hypothetical protein